MSKIDILRAWPQMFGWNTKRKLVIFESDDWGSIRMPNQKVFALLSAKGILGDKTEISHYNKFDTLASKEDFECLFDLLSSFKARNGKSPVFTALSLVANPDFQKIKESDFNDYVWEPLKVTLSRYGLDDANDAMKEGEAKGVFIPEFHGREHLNVGLWLQLLKSGNSAVLAAFELECWTIKRDDKMRVQAAFNWYPGFNLDDQALVLAEGLAEFERQYGRRASFFVPPNGPFNSQLETGLNKRGLKYMGISKLQLEPIHDQKYKKKLHYLGQRSKTGLIYLTRNAFFEPSQGGKDWTRSCLKEVDIAFKYRKPAVISTHRVNYVGGLSKENRDKGLIELSNLIASILKQWPDVEFITSSQLGDIIENKVS